MRGMTTTSPETHPALLVDCPLCNTPAPFEAAGGVLTCDACGVALEIAEPRLPGLGVAA